MPNLNTVVLIRDQDDERDQRDGMEQARGQVRREIAIVVGLAIEVRENSVICGFDPRDDRESARVEVVKQTAGFDPRLQSHELTACKDDSAIRSPKRVLRQLAEGNRDRECNCWQEASLAVLQGRGGQNGLADYLQEVRDRLAPSMGRSSGE